MIFCLSCGNSTSVVELGFQQEEYTVYEGDEFITICLELISGQLASTVELSANLSTQDNDAQSGTLAHRAAKGEEGTFKPCAHVS